MMFLVGFIVTSIVAFLCDAESRGPVIDSIMKDLKDATKQHKPRSYDECKHVFRTKSETASWPPPNWEELSKDMQDKYSMHGKIEIGQWYFAQEYNGGQGYTWPAAYVNASMERPIVCGQYHTDCCAAALNKYTKEVNGKMGMVIGSESPWAEAALLSTGAKHVITYEYMPIETDHPQMSAMHPKDVAASFLNDTWTPVDFAWSYSSLEHDGLGRYGDPLNPNGDIHSMFKVACLLKPGGIFFFGVPTGQDAVVFNAHRIYGSLRLKMMFANFEVVGVEGTYMDEEAKRFGGYKYQPVFILRRKEA